MSENDHKSTGEVHHELHSHLPPEPALRVKAMESLLIEKGMLDPATVDAWVETYTDRIGPKCGAAIVAKAWSDPDFKARLLEDGTQAVKKLDNAGWAVTHLKVIENTPDIHNLIVCTLCSCYPHAILGPPPNWYKMAAYRSRAVRDPRGVLSEFGVELPEDIELLVWDSTSELRYLVLPERPAKTEGWSEERLASIVTRNSMIGTDRELSSDSVASNSATIGQQKVTSNNAAIGQQKVASNSAAIGQQKVASNSAAIGQQKVASNSAAIGQQKVASNSAAIGQQKVASNSAAIGQQKVASNSAAIGQQKNESA